MSIKVEFSNGVFKPLEKVDNVPMGAVYTVLSEDELRSLTEDLQWLKSSEKSFEFWDNPEDTLCYGAPYSRLQGFYCSRWMGRPSVASLPLPLSSKRREGRQGWSLGRSFKCSF